MTDIFRYSPRDALPDQEEVLRSQGRPDGADVSPATEALFSAAIADFLEAASPVAIIKPISKEEFGELYRGEGENESRTPVADIAPRAERLAMFVATIGEPVCQRIRDRFAERDYARAYMLDSIASVAADRTAELAQRQFETGMRTYPKTRIDGAKALAGKPPVAPNGGCGIGSANIRTEGRDIAVLRYSPGYCGWHMTGQRKLFEFVQPDRIGVSLTPSCLMQPLKSVSGVMIAGPREIHNFEPSYPCCAECETHGCRARIERLFAD